MLADGSCKINWCEGRSNIAAVRKMMCHWERHSEDAKAIIDIIDAGGEVRNACNNTQ